MNTDNKLCTIFEILARRTWNDLKDAYDTQFLLGEESITDFLLLNLKRLCPSRIISRKFNRHNESKTGADWEWWLVGNNKGFGMRVQAKKLNLYSLTYEGLDHQIGRSKRKQCDVLIADAIKHKLYPIYCFYNYWKNLKQIPHWNCRSFFPHWDLFGCSISNAYLIKQCIQSNISDVYNIGSISLPWQCLICCTGYSSPGASLPERAYGLAEALRRFKSKKIVDTSLEIYPVPVPIDKENFSLYLMKALSVNNGDYSFLDEFFLKRKIDGLLIIKDDKTEV